jgi:hypothetical protein
MCTSTSYQALFRGLASGSLIDLEGFFAVHALVRCDGFIMGGNQLLLTDQRPLSALVSHMLERTEGPVPRNDRNFKLDRRVDGVVRDWRSE